MSNEFVIKCVDAETGRFVGFLRSDHTTIFQKGKAARFTEAKATREVKMINHYGKYKAEKVKL